MNSFTPQLPHVRIEPAAHQHLGCIIEALSKSGRNISMARYVSDLILSQSIPMPNGTIPTPPADPCEHKES